MNDEFVPELHDIGKILDKSNRTGLKNGNLTCSSHTYLPENSNDFRSVTWWSMFHHHNSVDNEDINEWLKTLTIHGQPIPKEHAYNLFLLKLADHAASSIARVLRGKKYDEKDLITLWNWTKEHNPTFISSDKLIGYVNENNLDKFLKECRNTLKHTPEDKSFPRNVTTLYTHITLVGKIYRVLKSSISLSEDNNGLYLMYNGKRATKVSDAEDLWYFRLLKCHVRFTNSFVRLHDINLLRKREEIMRSMIYYDNVLFATSDFLLLLLPINYNERYILNQLLDNGFYIEVDYIEDNLKNLDSKAKSKYKGYLYEELDKEIDKICEVCQLRPASKEPWKKSEEESIEEWLCEKCKKIRDMGEPFRKYGEEWDREVADVCWFKFSLYPKKLEDWLPSEYYKGYLLLHNEIEILKDCKNRLCHLLNIYENEVNKIKKEYNKEDDSRVKKELATKIEEIYNKKINPMKYNIDKLCKKIGRLSKISKELSEEFKDSNVTRIIALQIYFIEDYKSMLEEFWKRMKGKNDIHMPIKDYYELGVFKYSPDLLKEVIENYCKLFNEYFPNCVSDDKCPINLSLFVESVKYPLREYWRYLDSEDNKSFLNIRSHRHVGDEAYTKEQIEEVLKILRNKNIRSSFLHKLVEIHDNIGSDIFVEVEIYNNREGYPELYNAIASVKGLTANKILTLYKLLRKEVEEYA